MSEAFRGSVPRLRDLIPTPPLCRVLMNELKIMMEVDPNVLKISETLTSIIEKPGLPEDMVPIHMDVFEGFKNLQAELVGSIGEGLHITETFVDELDDVSCGEELDFTVIVSSIKAGPPGSGHPIVVRYLDEWPGYAHLNVAGEDAMETWLPLCTIATDHVGRINQLYLSPVSFTDEFFLLMSCRNSLVTVYNFVNHKIALSDMDFEERNVLSRKRLNLFKRLPMKEPLEESGEHNCDQQTDYLLPYFVITTQEGPAIKSSYLVETSRVQVDMATAIHCPTWPKPAEQWPQRVRPSCWPPVALIESIVRQGCFFVAKSPTHSDTFLEWRTSFVIAERTLMRSLPVTHRACYKIFKGIWRLAFRPPTETYVQSYHIKTIFLWLCEEIPVECWVESQMVPRVFDLLRRLRTCLQQKQCPQYFIPENNLFEQIEDYVIQMILKKVDMSLIMADRMWINNGGLFVLPCSSLTRLAMSPQINASYIESIKMVLEFFFAEAHKDDLTSPQGSKYADNQIDQAHMSKESPDFNDIVVNLAELFVHHIEDPKAKVAIIFVLQHISKVRKKLQPDVYDFLCSRITPASLIRFERRVPGLIYGLSSVISSLGALSELADQLASIEKSQKRAALADNSKGSTPTDEAVDDTDLESLLRTLLAGNTMDSDMEYDSSTVAEYDCDLCDDEILGNRYHCGTCDDFDICESCNTKHGHSHALVQYPSLK